MLCYFHLKSAKLSVRLLPFWHIRQAVIVTRIVDHFAECGQKIIGPPDRESARDISEPVQLIAPAQIPGHFDVVELCLTTMLGDVRSWRPGRSDFAGDCIGGPVARSVRIDLDTLRIDYVDRYIRAIGR